MKIISIFSIMLAFGLLVACSGSTETSQNTDTQTPTDESVPGSNEQPETATPPQNKPSGSGDDAKDALAAAFEGAVEYTASYDLTASDGRDTYTSSMTQYINARDMNNYKFRTDSEYGGIESQVYIVGDSYTTCTKMSGKWTCYSPEATDEEETETSNPSEDWEEDVSEDTSVVVRDGTMQVAGVTAECFLITMDDSSSTRYCIYDGVPLYVKSMDSDGTMVSEMKATSYKRSTANADFVPPAKPSSDPADMYGGYELPEGYEMPDY